MKYTIAMTLLIIGCHPTKQCPATDGGTTLQEPCMSADGKPMPNGSPCCLGTKPGTCHSNECVAD